MVAARSHTSSADEVLDTGLIIAAASDMYSIALA